MSDNSQNNRKQKPVINRNVLETLKNAGSSIGGNVTDSLKEDLIKKAPQDFMDQLFGPRAKRTYSGEITKGESLEINQVFSGEHAIAHKLQKQLMYERRLREEEIQQVVRKRNELRMQLKVVQDEVIVLAQSTQDLAKETQIAVMQAAIEPGVYHLVFFEKLLIFLKSFRKKIDEASVWLNAANKRAQKKNAWGANYKKHGAKYLLSGEHYLTRSAG